MSSAQPAPLSPLMFASLAVVFVLFWSTGFVAAKFGSPYAEPLTFLGTRFVIASVLLLVLCLALPHLMAAAPARLRSHCGAGLLVQSLYLIGVYCGIYLGSLHRRHGADRGTATMITGTGRAVSGESGVGFNGSGWRSDSAV